MNLQDLDLKPGTWVVSNCGNLPSVSNCQLVMMAPQDQREDLIAAATTHAVDKHGHMASEETTDGVTSTLELVEVP